MVNITPESRLLATYFRSFLLRNTGNTLSKIVPSRTVDAGHPVLQSGIIRVKAYISNKRMLPIDRKYDMYSSPFLLLAALDQDMIQDLGSMNRRSSKHGGVFTT